MRHFRRLARCLAHGALFALGLAAPAITAHALDRGRVLFDQSTPSAALGRDFVYSIYLPPDFPEAGRRYPVLYLFHGAGGNQRSWLNARFTALLDELIGSGQMPPLLVVTPAAERSFCVDSAESGGPGNFETAIRRDLIGGIEREYPVIAARAGRAVAGNSMGGFCALHLAFRRPYEFATVASLSGGFFGSHPPPPSLAANLINPVFGPRGPDSERYAAASPMTEIRDAEPGDAPPAYLAVGAKDQLGLTDDSRALEAAMRAAHLSVELHIDPDGRHDWPTWLAAAPGMLVFLGQHLKTEAP